MVNHRLAYVDILCQLEIRVADNGCSKKKKELLIADSGGEPKICHINKYGVMAYSGKMRNIKYIYNTKLHKELKFKKK